MSLRRADKSTAGLRQTRTGWLLSTVPRIAWESRALRPIAMVASRALKYALDLQFDLRHGVHARGRVETPPERRQEAAYRGAQPYEASRRRAFHRTLEPLRIEYRDFTFIDLGSGKGKTLVMAATMGFGRVIGVELSPELHRNAVANAARLARRSPRATTIEPVRMSASDFAFPPGPLVCYMYNPFDAATVKLVLANLQQSLEQAPRPAYVVYFHPVWGDVLRETEWLRPLHESGLCLAYQAMPQTVR